jgi:predicted nucleotidyltransferase
MTPVPGALEKIAQDYGLDAVYVFGSRARTVAARMVGAARPDTEPGVDRAGSDIDIGVLPLRARHLTARDRVRLTMELEQALESSPVDLVILGEADPFLAAEIVRGELLYAHDLDREAEIQLYFLRRAGDLAPFFREQWRAVMGHSP